MEACCGGAWKHERSRAKKGIPNFKTPEERLEELEQKQRDADNRRELEHRYLLCVGKIKC